MPDDDSTESTVLKQPTYSGELTDLPVFVIRLRRWLPLKSPAAKLLLRHGSVSIGRGHVGCESDAHAICLRDNRLPTFSFDAPPPLDLDAHSRAQLQLANTAAHAASVAAADALLATAGQPLAGIPEGGYADPYDLTNLVIPAASRFKVAPEECEHSHTKAGALILACWLSGADASRYASASRGLDHEILRLLHAAVAGLSVKVLEAVELRYTQVEGDGLAALSMPAYREFSENLVDWNNACAAATRKPASAIAYKLCAAVRTFGENVSTRLDVELRLSGATTVADVEAVIIGLIGDLAASPATGKSHLSRPGNNGGRYQNLSLIHI